MKKFIKFLEENNARGNFEKECKKGKNLELRAAFPWAWSKQGSMYWERLDAKWRQVNNAFRE
jgi:hypothetical protein